MLREVLLFIIVLHRADIKEEAIESRAEVKSFDHSKLKHVETEEKVTLPGAGGLWDWDSVFSPFSNRKMGSKGLGGINYMLCVMS